MTVEEMIKKEIGVAYKNLSKDTCTSFEKTWQAFSLRPHRIEQYFTTAHKSLTSLLIPAKDGHI